MDRRYWVKHLLIGVAIGLVVAVPWALDETLRQRTFCYGVGVLVDLLNTVHESLVGHLSMLDAQFDVDAVIDEVTPGPLVIFLNALERWMAETVLVNAIFWMPVGIFLWSVTLYLVGCIVYSFAVPMGRLALRGAMDARTAVMALLSGGTGPLEVSKKSQ